VRDERRGAQVCQPTSQCPTGPPIRRGPLLEFCLTPHALHPGGSHAHGKAHGAGHPPLLRRLQRGGCRQDGGLLHARRSPLLSARHARRAVSRRADDRDELEAGSAEGRRPLDHRCADAGSRNRARGDRVEQLHAWPQPGPAWQRVGRVRRRLGPDPRDPRLPRRPLAARLGARGTRRVRLRRPRLPAAISGRRWVPRSGGPRAVASSAAGTISARLELRPVDTRYARVRCILRTTITLQ